MKNKALCSFWWQFSNWILLFWNLLPLYHLVYLRSCYDLHGVLWFEPNFSFARRNHFPCFNYLRNFNFCGLVPSLKKVINGWHTSWHQAGGITSWHTCHTFLLAHVLTCPWVESFPADSPQLNSPYIHCICVFVIFSQLLCSIVTPCECDVPFSTFMISSVKFLKRLPCSSFVNMSAAIFSEGLYTTLTSFFEILSWMKKYLMLLCLVCLLL